MTLHLNGRSLYQFNAGTLDMAPADGDRIGVDSRHGKAFMPVQLDARVRPGELFATFHAAEVFLKNLTSPHRDRIVMTPEYRIVAVRVEKA